MYLWFHNFTSSSEEKISESRKGFVYKQKTRTKVKFAIVIAFIFSSALLLFPGAMTLPMEILIFFTKIPIITLGFFAGVPLEKLYVTVRTLMGVVDKVENKEINIGDEFSGAIGKVVGKAESFVSKTKESVSKGKKDTPKTDDTKKVMKPKPKTPSISDKEALDHLKNFNNN